MGSEKQELEKNIDSLKSYVRVLNPVESAVIKVLENVGDNSYVIKFPVFNDYDLNVTIQVPSN